MRRLVLVAATGLCVAACDLVPAPSGEGGAPRETAASAGAFAHTQSEDISGYYRVSGVAMGDLTLVQVFVGQTQDFEAWEAGRRSAGFAPVMMEFTRGSDSVRVLPERYSVSDGRVSMRGTAPGVGAVSFDARLDKGVLATARRNLGGAEEAAMTGSVNIGGRGFSGVKLHWYGGD